MRAGLLRHRINIEANTPTRDSFGASTASWAAIHTSLPATISPVRGKEGERGGAIASEVTHKITIRYASGISPDDRVVFGSRYFDIKSVIDVYERNRMIEMEVIERL